MGPNDPFATVQDVNPPTAIGAAPSAGQSSGALSQRVSVGALAGALVAMIGNPCARCAPAAPWR